MEESDWPYGSWRFRESPLRTMLHCGSRYNDWVVHALKYLPRDIFDVAVREFAIYSTAQRDGCRIARTICEEREIILLSDRVLPKKGAEENHRHVRYFIYVVLHEVAHALKKHRSAVFDHLTEDEASDQEKEADALALSWFNKHVEERNNPYLQPLTYEEIEEAKEKNKELMNTLYDGG